jgi:hypothetical protein
MTFLNLCTVVTTPLLVSGMIGNPIMAPNGGQNIFDAVKQGSPVHFQKLPCEILTKPKSSDADYVVEFRGSKGALQEAGFSLQDPHVESSRRDKSQKDEKGDFHIIVQLNVKPQELSLPSVELTVGQAVQLHEYKNLSCTIQKLPEQGSDQFLVEYHGPKDQLENAGLSMDQAWSNKRDKTQVDDNGKFWTCSTFFVTKEQFLQNQESSSSASPVEKSTAEQLAEAQQKQQELLQKQRDEERKEKENELALLSAKFEQRLSDISNLGDSIQSKQRLPLGTPVQITWEDPNKKPRNLKTYTDLQSGMRGFVAKVPKQGDDNYVHNIEIYDIQDVTFARSKAPAVIACFKEENQRLVLENSEEFFRLVDGDGQSDSDGWSGPMETPKRQPSKCLDIFKKNVSSSGFDSVPHILAVDEFPIYLKSHSQAFAQNESGSLWSAFRSKLNDPSGGAVVQLQVGQPLFNKHIKAKRVQMTAIEVSNVGLHVLQSMEHVSVDNSLRGWFKQFKDDLRAARDKLFEWGNRVWQWIKGFFGFGKPNANRNKDSYQKMIDANAHTRVKKGVKDIQEIYSATRSRPAFTANKGVTIKKAEHKHLFDLKHSVDVMKTLGFEDKGATMVYKKDFVEYLKVKAILENLSKRVDQEAEGSSSFLQIKGPVTMDQLIQRDQDKAFVVFATSEVAIGKYLEVKKTLQGLEN